MELTCDGCGVTLQVAERLAGTTVTCPECGDSVVVPGPTQPQAAAVSRPRPRVCRLDDGYTEFTIWVVDPRIPFPFPEICSACGEPVGKDNTGATREFSVTHESPSVLGTGTEVKTFKGKVHLCSACAGAGVKVEDCIQFGFGASIEGHLVLQVADEKVAEIWRVTLQKYDRLVNDVLREMAGRSGKIISGDLVSVVKSDNRWRPGTGQWNPPLRNVTSAASTGCLVLLALAAAVAGGCAALCALAARFF